ncbi:MAG: helix-turn-helix domain-containing protein [Pyrobaculum sp.]
MPKVKCNCKEAARRLISLGLSYSEVSRILGVSEKTVKKWAEGVKEREARAEGPKPAELAVKPAVAAEAMPKLPLNNEWVRLLREKGSLK